MWYEGIKYLYVMRIGFDAKRAYHNATGLGNYSRTLILSLAEYYPENHYFLFNTKPSDRFSMEAPGLHEVLPSGMINRALPSLWRSSRVKKDLLKNQIDIYHGLSHEIPFGIQRSGIKSVVTIHDLIFEKYPEQFNPVDVLIYRRKFRYACEKSNLIIAVSEQTKRDISEVYGISQDKIRVCYQSCRPDFFDEPEESFLRSARQKFGLPEQFYLYVGSIIERKNLHRIIEALRELNPADQLPLVVIGSGNAYREKVVQLIKQSGLEEKVIFLSERKQGPITEKDLPALYKMATALIYPSLYEGFGIPVLEALATGTPVITSKTSCLPEAGGPASLYADPLDSTDIARAMEKIMRDTSLRSLMAEQGREHAKKFSRKKAASDVMDVYRELMKD
jgi:glycosyltransferase involved in cell wall biosynthesis